MAIVHHDLEQGSAEWLAARKGCITGSRFADARARSSGLDKRQTDYVNLVRAGISQGEAATQAGYKKPPTSEAVADAIANGITMKWGSGAIAYARDIARERIGGQAMPVFPNFAMRTGTEQEPAARRAYEVLTGNLVEEVGFLTTDDGLFGVSPDGRIGTKGALEVKTMVSSDTLFTALVDRDTSAYRDQILGYMWLLSVEWVDLCLWVHDLQIIKIVRFERDEEAVIALEEDLLAFAALVREQEAKLRAALDLNIAA